MKNIMKISTGLLAVVLFVALFVTAAPTEAKNEGMIKTAAEVKLLSEETQTVDSQKVIEARFLNMLNHNFAYNEVYNSVEDLVNVSMPALLQMRDENNEDYIANEIVAEYIYNMYGVEDVDFSQINTAFAQIEGYTYIIPRGFTVYTHQMASTSQNEDGTYTVKTTILVDAHDDYPVVLECETLFVENQNSTFGYNIVYSVIDFGELSI